MWNHTRFISDIFAATTDINAMTRFWQDFTLSTTDPFRVQHPCPGTMPTIPKQDASLRSKLLWRLRENVHKESMHCPQRFAKEANKKGVGHPLSFRSTLGSPSWPLFGNNFVTLWLLFCLSPLISFFSCGGRLVSWNSGSLPSWLGCTCGDKHKGIRGHTHTHNTHTQWHTNTQSANAWGGSCNFLWFSAKTCGLLRTSAAPKCIVYKEKEQICKKSQRRSATICWITLFPQVQFNLSPHWSSQTSRMGSQRSSECWKGICLGRGLFIKNIHGKVTCLRRYITPQTCIVPEIANESHDAMHVYRQPREQWKPRDSVMTLFVNSALFIYRNFHCD